jgi:hypothetical protein
MTIRTETITYGDFVTPAGTVVYQVNLVFTEAAGAVQTFTVSPGAQPSAVDLVPGAYTVVATAVNAGGTAIAPGVTDTFTILTPVTVYIPIALTGV